MAKRTKLTSKELAAAKRLLKLRPECHPGTSVCMSRRAQVKWFDQVRVAMSDVNLPDHLTGAFCDVAGVPS